MIFRYRMCCHCNELCYRDCVYYQLAAIQHYIVIVDLIIMGHWYNLNYMIASFYDIRGLSST